MTTSKHVLTTLPCSNLLKLSLCDWAVQLDWRAKDSPGILQATGLTYLELKMYNQRDLAGGMSPLTALHALPALQRFDLSVQDALSASSRMYSNMNNPFDADQHLPSCVIKGLTTLTGLRFNGVLGLESFQPFSRLSKLQHLHMNLQLGVWDEDSVQPELEPFAQLQALTHLSLDIAKCKGVSTSSSPPVAGCTRLQELHLAAPTLDASVLQGLTGLRRLYVWVPAVEGGADGVAALLSYVGHMQLLERLVLAGQSGSAVAALGVSDRELGRAVTASVNLAYLDLTGLKLLRSAWVHLFPVGRQRLQLLEFKLCFADISAFGDLLDCSALEQMVAWVCSSQMYLWRLCCGCSG